LYDGNGVNPLEEAATGHKKIMSKKVQAALATLLIFLAVIAGSYWFTIHRAKNLPAATNAPETSPKAPSIPPAIPNLTPEAKGTEGTANTNKPAASEGGPRLRSGESLEYAANVTKLNSTIANIKVTVGEQRNMNGKAVWHLQASAHTENPYRMIFELDDQFDSYSEPFALTSLQYEMHLNERGQKVDSVQRLLTSMKEIPPTGMMGARVLPGTRDPLGMLQYLRSVDWSKTEEVHSPVYDGRKLYDIRARLLNRSEAVAVPAGKYDATKIEIHVMDNGAESKDTHFLLYLANDAAHTPVLMEAVLPIATARVELTKAR
jgi:hypothetical protein